jgi:hypothetical protein
LLRRIIADAKKKKKIRKKTNARKRKKIRRKVAAARLDGISDNRMLNVDYIYSFALTFPSEMSGFRDTSLGKHEIKAQMSIPFCAEFPGEMSGSHFTRKAGDKSAYENTSFRRAPYMLML